MEHMTQTTLVPIHANVVFSSTIESGNYNSYSITIKSLHETSEKKTQKNPYASFFFFKNMLTSYKELQVTSINKERNFHKLVNTKFKTKDTGTCRSLVNLLRTPKLC